MPATMNSVRINAQTNQSVLSIIVLSFVSYAFQCGPRFRQLPLQFIYSTAVAMRVSQHVHRLRVANRTRSVLFRQLPRLLGEGGANNVVSRVQLPDKLLSDVFRDPLVKLVLFQEENAVFVNANR